MGVSRGDSSGASPHGAVTHSRMGLPVSALNKQTLPNIGARDEVDVLESDRPQSPHREADRTDRTARAAIDIAGCVRESGAARATTCQYTAPEAELEARRPERLLSTGGPSTRGDTVILVERRGWRQAIADILGRNREIRSIDLITERWPCRRNIRHHGLYADASPEDHRSLL